MTTNATLCPLHNENNESRNIKGLIKVKGHVAALIRLPVTWM